MRTHLPFARSALLFATAVVATSACTGDFDTTRRPPPAQGTLGDDLYQVLCDRVGASSIAEDLEGASFHGVCHMDATGAYADKVDQSLLPPSQSTARLLGVAKLEAMARRRVDLITAFNAIFPDTTLPDPKNPGQKVRVHDALVDLMRNLTPLYESNPYAPPGASPSSADSLPLLPSSTQALGRLFDALAGSEEAKSALSRISGRKGYRPLQVGLGAIRPALAYPGLRTLTQTALDLVGPGRDAEPELQAVLDVTEKELRTDTADPPLGPYVVADQYRAQPGRPRTDLEFIEKLLVSEDDAFMKTPTDAPRYIAARDSRGFIKVVGSQPGVAGSVGAPFADGDGDGMADVDAYGWFVDSSQAPVPVDLPFLVPGLARVRPADNAGRALDDHGQLLFQYVNTSRTLSGALTRDLLPLVDPNVTDAHETLMDTLAGARVLFGSRVQATKTTPYQATYQGFDPKTSPLVDLVYALGQVLGDKQSDDFLQSLIDLGKNHEGDVARLLGNALTTYENATDPQKPLNDAAHFPRNSIMWDEMADIVGQIAEVGPDANNPRGLLEDLLIALADDRSLKLGQAYSQFTNYKDRISYDPDNINGPTINLDSGGDHSSPHTPVDRTTPPSDTPGNRSDFQRFVQIIHDANGVKACNKDGAVIHAKLGGIPLNWPLTGKLNECDLFQIDDLAVFYLDAIMGRASLTIKDTTLNGLLNFLKVFGTTPDQLFEQSSGITGMTTHPTPKGLNRLVFFGSEAPTYFAGGAQPPDIDPYYSGKNSQQNSFVKDLIDPVGTAVCPKQGANGIEKCADWKDTFRARNANTIFLWEHFEFFDAMGPLLEAFANHGQEHLFVQLIEVVHRHWASAAHGPECNNTGDYKSNPFYCSEDGAVAYEPILVDAYASDMLPALHDFAKTLMTQQINSTRLKQTTRDGIDLTAELTRVLFDPTRAAAAGMVGRDGNAGTVWSDGVTPKAQLTPFDLFGNALMAMDDRFANASGYPDLADRKKAWKHARSQLVDQFLKIDGTGTSAAFHNQAVPKVLPILLQEIREQVNANCPDREQSTKLPLCAWATHDLAQKTADSMGGPVFAALMDLQEKIRANPEARREIEKLLTYLLSEASDADALQATLASMSDIFQILRDDPNMAPILSAVSNAAAPDATMQDGKPTPGLAATTIKALQALTDPNDTFDRYRVVDTMLKNLVTPMDPKQPSLTPLEVLIDTIAEVDRLDSQNPDAGLSPEDYGSVATSVRDFLTSKTRGLEQFYTVVRNRNGN